LFFFLGWETPDRVVVQPLTGDSVIDHIKADCYPDRKGNCNKHIDILIIMLPLCLSSAYTTTNALFAIRLLLNQTIMSKNKIGNTICICYACCIPLY